MGEYDHQVFLVLGDEESLQGERRPMVMKVVNNDDLSGAGSSRFIKVDHKD
jgi:hypothetical protein